jgi:CspA family cold shock protein
MPKGTIRRIMDRGYGFIKTDQEEDLFFHRNSLEGVEFASLSEGQAVEFEKGQGRDGRPAAVKVKLAEAQAEAQAETQAETQVDDSGDDKGGDDGGNGRDDGGNSGS